MAAGKPGEMSEQMKLYVQELLADPAMNQTQAAIRAGYSPRTAAESAVRLMKRRDIQEEIEKFKAERAVRLAITQDRVLLELARLAFVNPLKVIDAGEGTVRDDVTEDDAATIASVKVKTIPTEDGNIVEREVKLTDKKAALELLGKHMGMFKERLEVEIKGGIAERLKRARERRANVADNG